MIEFNNKEAYKIKIGNKQVDRISINNDIVYNLFDDYLYVENTYAGTNTVTLTTVKGTPSSGTYSTSIQWSKDKLTWTTVTFNTSTPYNITMNQGEKVYFRNDNGKFNAIDWVTSITASQSNNVGGDLLSIIDYTDILNITLLRNCFDGLFKDNTKLVSASALTIPSVLSISCCSNMFYNCQALTGAPSLPALVAEDNCYYQMFYNCQSLVNAPALPATTVKQSCYRFMFQNCYDLRNAPALPAQTLSDACYNGMFRNCNNLRKVTIYADDITATDCITNWLYGVYSTGNFYNLGTATYTTGSPSGIPTGWTVHTSL